MPTERSGPLSFELEGLTRTTSFPEHVAPRPRTPKFDNPRGYAVFGPKTGVSTLLSVLKDAAESTRIHIVGSDNRDISSVIAEAGNALKHADIVFLDGAPRSEDEVRMIADSRVVDPGAGGAFIRIWSPPVVTASRGMTKEAHGLWTNRVGFIDQAIQRTAFPYFTIPHEDGQDAMLATMTWLVRHTGVKD